MPQRDAHNLCTMVLDLTPSAVIMVDEGCGLLYVNGRARAILDRGDGLSQSGSQLAATDDEMASALRRAVKKCAASSSVEVLTIPRDHSRLPLLLRLSPTAKASCLGRAKSPPVLVFVGEPEHSTVELDACLLQRLHGLTEREAQLARWLAMGKRIPEAAIAMGITYNTARDHLRSVLSKTRVTSQAELLRLVWASPVWP